MFLDVAPDAAEAAGRALGYSVLPLTYNKTDWPCRQIEEILQAAIREGVLPRMPSGRCVASHKMGDVSHRELSLRERVGPLAADVIAASFNGTGLQWMLDLSRESPPSAADEEVY